MSTFLALGKSKKVPDPKRIGTIGRIGRSIVNAQGRPKEDMFQKSFDVEISAQTLQEWRQAQGGGEASGLSSSAVSLHEEKPGIRPAARSIIASRRMLHLVGHDWDDLKGKRVRLTLNYSKRMVLRWEKVEGVLEAGSCNLLDYPKSQSLDGVDGPSDMLAVDQKALAIMIVELIKSNGPAVEELRDVSGAGLIHLLVLGNKPDSSLELAMQLFSVRPKLLLCVHDAGREAFEDEFTGEGSLHILAVNEREDAFERLIQLAHESLEPREFEALLMQKCTGRFFTKNVPMFGATPLAFAACFGFVKVLKLLFTAEAHHEQIDDGCGGDHPRGLLSEEQCDLFINGSRSRNWYPALGLQEDPSGHGYFPIHAVVACGDTSMYDLLVEECKAIELGKELGCPRTALEQLTPLQLATKLGRKDMFRHILKRRVILVWQWGPEAEYRIPLDEIDSANSQGSLTVLELLVHPGVSNSAHDLLLDDFLNGFLFKQYEDKWRKFVRGLYVLYLLVLAAHVVLGSLLAAPSILDPSGGSGDATGRDVASHPGALLAQMVVAALIAGLELLEILLSLCSGEDGIYLTIAPRVKLAQFWRMIRDRAGLLLLLSTCCSLAGSAAILAEGADAARAHASVRVLLAVGASSSWVALLLLGYLPFRELSTFVNVVFVALVTDVRQFLAVFIPLLVSCTTGISCLLQTHGRWATRWGSWWTTMENLLLLAFVQEPPEIHGDAPYPSSFAGLLSDASSTGGSPLAPEAMVPTVLVYALFFLYIVVSVILLVNLLIAMMTKRYETRRADADRDTRVAFGRLVIRFEKLVALLIHPLREALRILPNCAQHSRALTNLTSLGDEKGSRSSACPSRSNTRSARRTPRAYTGTALVDESSVAGGHENDASAAPSSPYPTPAHRAFTGLSGLMGSAGSQHVSAGGTARETRYITFRTSSKRRGVRNIFDAEREATLDSLAAQLEGLEKRLHGTPTHPHEQEGGLGRQPHASGGRASRADGGHGHGHAHDHAHDHAHGHAHDHTHHQHSHDAAGTRLETVKGSLRDEHDHLRGSAHDLNLAMTGKV